MLIKLRNSLREEDVYVNPATISYLNTGMHGTAIVLTATDDDGAGIVLWVRETPETIMGLIAQKGDKL